MHVLLLNVDVMLDNIFSIVTIVNLELFFSRREQVCDFQIEHHLIKNLDPTVHKLRTLRPIVFQTCQVYQGFLKVFPPHPTFIHSKGFHFCCKQFDV